jgi:hypothetical protein
LGGNDFDNAIAEYNKALALNVDNPTAQAKVKSAQDAKKAWEQEQANKAAAEAAAAKKAEFDKFIAAGDGKLGGNDFDNAIAEYNKALALNVDNPTAQAKVKSAQDAKKAWEQEQANKAAAEAAAAKKAEFDKFIAAGDGKLGGNDFDNAIAEYNKALALNVDNPTAQAKVKSAQDAKKAWEQEQTNKAAAEAAAAKKTEFDKFIAAGDGKLGGNDFDNAIAEYNKALALNVDNPTAQAKVKSAQDAKKAWEQEQANKAAAEAAAAKKAEFDKFIAAGDGKLGGNDFDNAIAEYNKALALNVDNPTAQAKVKSAQDAKKAWELEQANKSAAEAAAAKKAEFDKFIAAGDGKLGGNDFDNAIAEYNKALALNVDNPTAQAKVKSAQDAKKAWEQEQANKAAAEAAAAKKAEFDKFIAAGDGKLGGNEFDNAIAEYNKALALNVDNPTAQAKVKSAQDAKKAWELEQANKSAAEAAAAKKAEFDKFIAAGDGKLGGNEFDNAIAEYNKALVLNVDNPTAQAKVKSAQDAKKAWEKEQADKAAADANAKKAQFEAFLSSGDAKLGSKDFDNAVAEYNKALALNFDNPAAQAKIKAAQDAKSAYEKETTTAAKDKQFQDFIKQGDDAVVAKDWVKAKEYYSKANEINPTSPLPQQKTNQVNEAMAAETAVEQDKMFNSILAKAEEFKVAGEYSKAKEILTKAKNNFPAKSDVVAVKIKEIDDILAAQAAKEKQYNDFLALADNNFESKKWEIARENYKKAISVFDREYPKKQLAIIDKYIEEEKSKASQNAELEAKRQQYDALMIKAKGEADAKKYQDAIITYQQAKALMPSETLPKQRIDEINAILAAQAKGAEQDKQYKDALAAADAARDAAIAEKSDDKAEQAKQLYVKANAIKSDDKYPQSQVDLLNKKMAEWAELKAKEQYQKIIDKADELFADKKYEDAKKLYLRAKDLNPTDAHPPKRLKEIDNLLADGAVIQKYNEAIKAADAARDAAVAAKSNELVDKAKELYVKANSIKSDEKYPQAQVDFLNSKSKEWAEEEAGKAYMKIIEKADELFASEKWDDAEKLYTRANGLKPSDPYPPAQLAKIKERRNFSATAGEYNEFIKKGNAAFETQNYTVALSNYQGALQVKPGSAYPQQRIDEINALLKKKKDEDKKAATEVARNVPPDPFPYGEEVNISEEEIARYMQDGRISEDDARAAAINARKEGYSSTFDEDKDKSTKRTEVSEGYYQKIEETKERQDIEKDNYRQSNVVSVENFKDTEYGKFDDKIVVEQERSNTIYETNQNSSSDRSRADIQADERRQDVIVRVEDYKDAEFGKFEDKRVTEINRSDAIHAANDVNQSDRTVADIKADDRRQEVIYSLEEYKDDEFGRYEDKRVIEVDRSDAIHAANDVKQSDRTVADIKADDRRQDVIVQVENYRDAEYGRLDDKRVTEIDRSDAIHAANDVKQSDRTVADIKADDRRQDVIVQVENYRDAEYGRLDDKRVTEIDRSDAIHAANDVKQSDRTVADIKADDRRQDVIVQVENYRDAEYGRLDDKRVTEIERSDAIHAANDVNQSDRTIADIKADERRENLIPEIEKYKIYNDKITTNQQGTQEGVTYTTYLSKEELVDKYAQFAEDGDVPRQEKVEAVDLYKEQNFNDNGLEVSNAILRTDVTANTIIAANTAQMSLFTDEDATREKNIEAVDGYKSVKLNENSELEAEKAGQGFDVSAKIEEQKSKSPTDFSDANIDPLAAQYPQGVTEKVFQRKDAKGEVIEFTILRIVVDGNKANEYKKVTTRWGVNYFKNGGAISQHIWDTETN